MLLQRGEWVDVGGEIGDGINVILSHKMKKNLWLELFIHGFWEEAVKDTKSTEEKEAELKG